MDDPSARASYLSNFEQLVVDHGVGIQHVFGVESAPCFSYTVGLFEVDHPELIVFGIGQQQAQPILNDLAFRVLRGQLRLQGNSRVHQLLRGTHTFLVAGSDPDGNYLGTAYSIRNRRHPELADQDLDLLQVVFADPHGRFPWDLGCDYADWPLLGPTPDQPSDLTLHQD